MIASVNRGSEPKRKYKIKFKILKSHNLKFFLMKLQLLGAECGSRGTLGKKCINRRICTKEVKNTFLKFWQI